ncbi:MAG: hypothetical protein DHS20C18_25360 [Saprospiraceae bacterium]|nr:MAG: hypothetical protein DHS20C18_25360 [Saprospiraceae bacterium]
MNPALTGIFRGDARVMANYRSQWTSVPVDYMTFTGAFDKKFLQRTGRKGYWSGGLAFNYDQAGLAKLRLINLGLSAAYTKDFSETFFGTLGGALSIGQRSFKIDDLTFDRQYDTGVGVYNPGLPTQEDFDHTSRIFPDLALGLNFRWQSKQTDMLVDRLDKRSKLDFGVGIHHLLRPDQSFQNADEAKLPIRLSPYLMGTLMLAGPLDLIGNFNAQFQKPYTEYVGMLGLKVHFNRNLGRQLAVQLDFGYRFNDFGDAFYPGVELFYNGWELGFTYDVNVSDFKLATNKRGGPELSLRYIIRHVRPLPAFKICPLI